MFVVFLKCLDHAASLSKLIQTLQKDMSHLLFEEKRETASKAFISMTDQTTIVTLAIELCVVGSSMTRPIPPLAELIHALTKNVIEGRFIRCIGNGQGPAANQFNSPFGCAVLPNGPVVVCDNANHRLQVVNVMDGRFIRFIGNGPGAAVNQFFRPSDVCVLENGHVVVCDGGNSRLQIVNPTDGTFIRSMGNGRGCAANQLDCPSGCTALRNGYVAVCDHANHRLQIVNLDGGVFIRSIGNGQGSAPNQFNGPMSLTALPNGHLVVCDYSNCRLQIVDPTTGTFIRSIGNGLASITKPNKGRLFNGPISVSVLLNGQVVVVCDEHNSRLQVVNLANGTVIRSIGHGGGSAANQFQRPSSVAVLQNGHVVVCDYGNHRLQIVA